MTYPYPDRPAPADVTVPELWRHVVILEAELLALQNSARYRDLERARDDSFDQGYAQALWGVVFTGIIVAAGWFLFLRPRGETEEKV
jgi:hypothetical protein